LARWEKQTPINIGPKQLLLKNEFRFMMLLHALTTQSLLTEDPIKIANNFFP